MSLRLRIRRAFEDPTYPSFTFFNVAGLAATLAAVALAVLQTETWAVAAYPWMGAAERAFAALFAAEYALRLWSSERPLRYARSFFGIVDLLSFLPSFLTAGNLTFLKATRMVRMLRFLRLARIAKVAQIERGSLRAIQDDDRRIVAQNARVYLGSLIMAVVLLGMLANFCEPQTYEGGLEGIRWAMGAIMGGAAFAPVTPVTPAGQLLDLLARFTGMFLLGMLINLAASIVNRIVLGRNKRVEEITVEERRARGKRKAR
jgi:voltage-gated potassium channel